MTTYTVLSLIDSTGEVLADHIPADGPHEAMTQVANATGHDDLQILCAFPGEVQVTTPCEDAGKAAYVNDLKTCECGRQYSACATSDGKEEHRDRF